jgi:hypothetical protein
MRESTGLGCRQARRRALLGGLDRRVSYCISGWTEGLTLQNLGLRNVRFARTLQRSAVDKIEHYAVGQLLSVLVGWIRCAELAEVEALNYALFVGPRRAEHEVAQAINLYVSTLPQQRVGELDVEVANVHGWRRLSKRGEGCGARILLGRIKVVTWVLPGHRRH